MAKRMTKQQRESLEWLRRLATDPDYYMTKLGPIYRWVKRRIAADGVTVPAGETFPRKPPMSNKPDSLAPSREGRGE